METDAGKQTFKVEEGRIAYEDFPSNHKSGKKSKYGMDVWKTVWVMLEKYLYYI